MNKNKMVISVAVVTTITGLCFLLNGPSAEQRKSKKPAPPSRTLLNNDIAHNAPQGNTVPTHEQMAFVSNILLPQLHSATQNYPHLEIRERFARFCDRIKQGGDIDLVMAPNNPDDVIASVKAVNGTPVLTVRVPVVRNFYLISGGNLDVLEDIMIMTLLHEEYHITHHIHHQTLFRRAESEAWWHIVETVHIPMVRIGRARFVSKSMTNALNAYAEANGNPEASSWQNFLNYIGK